MHLVIKKHFFIILKVATKHLNVCFSYFQAPATRVSRPFKTRVGNTNQEHSRLRFKIKVKLFNSYKYLFVNCQILDNLNLFFKSSTSIIRSRP